MTRIRRVERLGALYRRMEQMRELELHRAASAVDDIVTLQDEERADDRAEAHNGRAALAVGDTQEWMVAEAGRELIGLRMLRHRAVQIRVEQEHEAATDSYCESRMQREQMERVATGQRRLHETIEGRRTQAASDDRFLSRRAWLQNRAAVADGSESQSGVRSEDEAILIRA